MRNLEEKQGNRLSSNEYFRLLIETVRDYSILGLDQDGLITSCNAGTECLKGYKREEVIGKHFSLFYPSADNEVNRSGRQLKLAAERGHIKDDGWSVRKDGSQFWAEVVITALRDRVGQLQGFSKITRDVTERRTAQDELQRSHFELEEKVRKRTAQLSQINEKLQREISARQVVQESLQKLNEELGIKNDEIEAFAYSTSHDLRGPLLNLQGFTLELREAGEALARFCHSLSLSPDEKARLEEIKKNLAVPVHYISSSSDKLQRLIEALLKVSRTGRQDYKLVEIDIPMLIQGIVDSLHHTIEKHGTQIKFTDLPNAFGDRNAVEQVFANLISNSLNYLDPQRPGTVEISGEKRNGLCHYRVSDNGVGISENSRDRLFKVFQRLSPQLANGEGIGLLITKRIVAKHGGTIWVDSKLGEGSTFHVTLPSSTLLQERT